MGSVRFHGNVLLRKHREGVGKASEAKAHLRFPASRGKQSTDKIVTARRFYYVSAPSSHYFLHRGQTLL
jgi:hypothetical protein